MAITFESIVIMPGERKKIPGRPLGVYMGGMTPGADPAVMIAYEKNSTQPTTTDVISVESGEEIPQIARRFLGCVSWKYNVMCAVFAVDEMAESSTAIANGLISAIGTTPARLTTLLRGILG